jgi:hypothetical protein
VYGAHTALMSCRSPLVLSGCLHCDGQGFVLYPVRLQAQLPTILQQLNTAL